MASFTPEELTAIGDAEELRISSQRGDGTFRPYVTIWAVRVGDEIYVRSAYGTDNPWFLRALVTRLGRISAGGVEREVSFEDARPDVHDGIDSAYRAKYVGGNAQYVPPVVSDQAHAATLLVVPR